MRCDVCCRSSILVYRFKKVKKILHTRLVPLIAVFSAFSFVIMMFNLPLPGGTTGHAVGIGITAVVLGLWASILAVSIALFMQAVFFGDGGITAFGANCFNMAIIGSMVTYGVYRLIAGHTFIASARRVAAAAFAGYIGINASAFLLQLSLVSSLLYFIQQRVLRSMRLIHWVSPFPQ